MQNFGIMRYILPILVLISVLLTACLNKESNTTTTSSEARVSTFTFMTDTANPGLTATTYKVEHRTDTGLIYSVDSLAFGTRLDSVVPSVTYMATPGTVNFILPDTTIISTGVDTMDFTKKPIYLHVLASDMETEKFYEINIAVHQANPDLYVWSCLTDNIFAPQPAPNCETKAFHIQDQIIVFVNDGLSTRIYQSKDGEKWETNTQTIAGLPVPCHVRDILRHGQELYYIDGTSLYTSSDLTTWTEKDYSSANFTPINMLVSYDGKPWCIVQDNTSQGLMLATIQGDQIEVQTEINGLEGGVLPAGFPISDFAALEFSSSSERPRAMVVGGRAMNGDIVNARWNLEYAAKAGYRIKDFSIAQPTFETLNGVSIIQYDDQLMMFGGTDNNLEMRTDILYSKDEGMNWYVPDSANNQLPRNYTTRSHQSVVVDNEDNIYIIGGQTTTQSLSDVYRGFLNSSKWD